MKTICIYSCLLISFTIYCQDSLKQYIHVKYGLVANITEFEKRIQNDKNKDNEFFKQAARDMSEALVIAEKLISLNLISDNQSTIFYRNEFLYPEGFDGLKKVYLENTLNSEYFYSKENNKLVNITSFSNKKYLVDFDLNAVQWEVLSETKTVNNFLCHKATYTDKKNYKYTAWFAPEVNFSVGPEFCYGLPGLVLEYNTETFSIVCRGIDFQLADDELAKLRMPQGESISQADFEEMIRKAKESFRN